MNGKSEPRNPLPPLVVGARGWLHPAWVGGFYPDDLPDDWRFAYYSNEFRTVLVPGDYWEQFDAEAVAQWREDAGDGFTFILELSATVQQGGVEAGVEAFLQRVEPLRGLVAGIVVSVSVPQLDVLLALLEPHYPLFIDTGNDELSAESHHWQDGDRAELCWRPGLAGLTGCRLGMMRAEDDTYELRGLRMQVEAFLRQCGSTEQAYLIVDGGPPGFRALRDIGTMARLLGA